MGYRYLGNKTKLTSWISSTLGDVLGDVGRVADPMCGTGSVSEALALDGHTILAADALRFPTLHAKARLHHPTNLDFQKIGLDSYSHAIETLNELEPLKGLFWVEYSADGQPENGAKPRRYFSGENAAHIDAIRRRLLKWRKDGLSPNATDRLLHDLILAVNRVANITGTYGYYRSSWNRESLKPLTLKMSKPSRSAGEHHTVLHGRAKNLLDEINKCDVCYLDPPYTKRQYGGNYHILETLAREDEPTPAGDGGLRDWQPDASDFCYKRKALGAFNTLLSGLRVPIIAISYSTDGQVSPDDLLDTLSGYGSVVRHDMPFSRFNSNGRVRASDPLQEHLYIVDRRAN